MPTDEGRHRRKAGRGSGVVDITHIIRRWRCTLLVFIDDGTGQLMELRFVQAESAFDHFAALRNAGATRARRTEGPGARV